MRLIDADALKREEICAFEYGTFKPTTGWIVDSKTIDDAPTVEAIPIDWITKWADKFFEVINGRQYYMGDGYDTIWDMLADWEKEYGKD